MIRKTQYAALPFTAFSDDMKICLITSRDTGRWIIPKGWPQDGLRPEELAALEAYEEAGLRGKTAKKPIGSFKYMKVLKDGSEIECEVDVYPMLVEHQADKWPEQQERKVLWVKRKKACRLLDDAGLASLLQEFCPESSKAWAKAS